MAHKDNGNGNGKVKLSRRDFLKLTTAAGAAGGLLDLTMQSPAPAFGASPFDSYDYTAKTTCPFCAVGCGFEIGVDTTNDPNRTTVANFRPNKDHPVNGSAACPKGQAGVQLVNSPRRLGAQISGYTAPTGEAAVYQGPAIKYNNVWYAVSWDTIINSDSINLAIHSSTPGGPTTSLKGVAKLLADIPADERPQKVGFLGSAHMNNEENYLYRKLIALYGTPNTDHQAQI